MRPTRLLLVLGTLGFLLATTGCTGKDGASCSVTQNPDGSATLVVRTFSGDIIIARR